MASHWETSLIANYRRTIAQEVTVPEANLWTALHLSGVHERLADMYMDEVRHCVNRINLTVMLLDEYHVGREVHLTHIEDIFRSVIKFAVLQVDHTKASEFWSTYSDRPEADRTVWPTLQQIQAAYRMSEQ